MSQDRRSEASITLPGVPLDDYSSDEIMVDDLPAPTPTKKDPNSARVNVKKSNSIERYALPTHHEVTRTPSRLGDDGSRTARDVFEDFEDVFALNTKVGAVSSYSVEDLLIIRAWTIATTKYFCFVLLFSFVVFYNRPGEEAFYFTNNLREILVHEEYPDIEVMKTFLTSSEIAEFIEYLEGPLINALYPVRYYNNDTVDANFERYINDYDRLVGLVRIRQKRIKKNTCKVPPVMQSIYKNCYAEYDEDIEDTKPFGPPGNRTKYKYEPPDPNERSWSHLAKLTSYAPGGYVIDLPKSRREAKAVINQLRDDRFIDEYTRAVFVEFSVYNGNLNVFCIIRIVAEMPPGGGYIPSTAFRTLRLLRYVTATDRLMLGLQVVLALFVLWYIGEEVYSLVYAVNYSERGWRAYFIDDKWHYLDVSNLFIFIVIIALRVVTTQEANRIINSRRFQSDDQYVELQNLAFLQQNEQYLNAFNMLFCWIKTFKYLEKLPRIGQLVKTLATAALDTLLFVVMFFFVFVGYSQCGYMMFSMDIFDFRTIPTTMQSMMRFIVGDFNYAEIQNSNRLLGPIFFFTYMILVFFVLLNMFIAIINNAYELVRSDEILRAEKKRKEREIRKFLFPNSSPSSTWDRFIAFCQMIKAALLVRKEPSLIELVESGAIDEDGDGLVTREELIERLPEGMDIDGLLEVYDTDNDGVLDTNEVKKWLKDLRDEKAELEQMLSQLVAAKEMGVDAFEPMQEKKLKSRVLSYLQNVKTKVPGDSSLMQLRFHADGLSAAAADTPASKLAPAAQEEKKNVAKNIRQRRLSLAGGSLVNGGPPSSRRKSNASDDMANAATHAVLMARVEQHHSMQMQQINELRETVHLLTRHLSSPS